MTIRRRRRTRLLAVLAVLTLLVAACGDDDDDVANSGDTVSDDTGDTAAGDTATDDTGDTADGEAASIPVIDIVASESTADDGTVTYSFAPPEGVTAGPAQLNLVNNGSSPHHVQLFHLNDDATMDQLGEKLAAGDVGGMLALGTFVGGTGVTDPGTESSADGIVDFQEGTYVLLCFIEDADGVPHAAHGMVQPFMVGPAVEDAAEVPEADATVHMVDFGYDSTTLPAHGVVELVNDSEMQLHEMTIIQLNDGATPADVSAFFAGEVEGPPPFRSFGGMQAVMPGASQLLQVDLEPGDYVILCGIPDPTDGVPHAEKGMAMPVSVA